MGVVVGTVVGLEVVDSVECGYGFASAANEVNDEVALPVKLVVGIVEVEEVMNKVVEMVEVVEVVVALFQACC